jgi:hypothetical protein
MDMARRNLTAQWVYDTRTVLGRFHLWLDDVEEKWVRGGPGGDFSFVGSSLHNAFVMATAVTALGTRLYGRYGEGKGADKTIINRVKKDADAISAYAASEALWHLTRSLPENHAVMVSLGEGLMPKAGETPEMGSNPLLGFGRVYARPEIARFLDRRVNRLINDDEYDWETFWSEVQTQGITIWGAAIDTLENTSRFAKGAATGPLAVIHLFDQPLAISLPYEGYMGCLTLPRQVVAAAEQKSVLVNYLTPRAKILDAIQETYPGIKPEHVHVWTLAGKSRETRLGGLWEAWQELGVHLIEEGWTLPGGAKAFTESGTYAPIFSVGRFEDRQGNINLIIFDGYAASAEAVQAASLDPRLDLFTSMAIFSSRFAAPAERETRIMQLDPASPTFVAELSEILDHEATGEDVDLYRETICHARNAGMPLATPTNTVDDYFPNKKWRGLALNSAMLDDPYSGMPGVEQVRSGVYRVTTRSATRRGIREVSLTLRLMESFEESRRVFLPLLDRFYGGEDYQTRPVKISDSGRIRNELQTWYSEVIEHLSGDRLRVRFDLIDDTVLPADKRALIEEVLGWYKTNHPIWFRWLELT